MDTSRLTQLGSGHPGPFYEHPDAAILETFDNPQPTRLWVVGLESTEFTSLCPITGQPDFGRILIHYVPGPRCVETKSLKLYLGAYRNHGAFHEACVNRIADDLQSGLAARWLRVFGDFRPRGGIAIRPLALRRAPDLDADEDSRCVALVAQWDSVGSGR
jgi:7-cyano-7-deazaguanine reductase